MWQTVLIDTLKSLIPFKYQLRRINRYFFPYKSLIPNDEFALQQGLDILRIVQTHSLRIDTVLEFGTGWTPTIPMLFKAAGAKSIILTDIEPLMDGATMEAARKFVLSRVDQVAPVLGLPSDEIKRRLNSNTDLFSYICPFDPATFPKKSVDLIYSRTVLEHIPEKVLTPILIKLRELLVPQGHSIHIIDNSDHFEHTNKSLSRLNFLKYSKFIWSIACLNQQNFQNRLRHSDYRSIFKAAGYTIIEENGSVDQKALEDLRHLKIQERFKSYTDEDLSILTSTFVMKHDLNSP